MITAFGLIVGVSLTAFSVAAQSTPKAEPVSGWVGITTSVTAQTDSEGNLTYAEYPVVVSVDAGSPAARAGILAGDTILSFNDRDLRRYALPLRTMIQPGKTFVIRARRGTANRVSKLIVAERPPDRPERFEIVMKAAPGVPTIPTAPFVLTPGPRPLMRATVPATSAVHATNMRMMLAGAELRPLSAELAEVLGIRAQGLFVVNVVDATPAKESGLRDGDVLLRAENTSLLTPIDLLRILQADLDKDVRLEILRKKKAQTIDLKW